MALTVKKAILWRTEVENRAGALARVLEPLASAGANLQVVMGYRFPGDESRAAIEVFPVTGKKVTEAAHAAGLSASSIPALIAQGDDRPGLGHAVARSLANAGINMSFQVAQVLGRRFTAVYGFESEDDAKKATSLVKKAGAPRRR
jgi:hypothetical protein